jgi:hypothetical protein
VQRRPTDGHRARNDSARGLVCHEIARPLVLSVLEAALAVLRPLFEIEQPLAGFDDDDGPGGTAFGKLLRDEGGGDSAADDDNVAFVAGGLRPPPPPLRAHSRGPLISPAPFARGTR